MSLGKTIVSMLEETKNLQKRVDELTKPRPMSEAPRDGTAILVFLKGESAPNAMCFEPAFDYWREFHRYEYIPSERMVGWLPCPTYTGDAL